MPREARAKTLVEALVETKALAMIRAWLEVAVEEADLEAVDAVADGRTTKMIMPRVLRILMAINVRHVLRALGVEQLALTGPHYQGLASHIAGDFYYSNGGGCKSTSSRCYLLLWLLSTGLVSLTQASSKERWEHHIRDDIPPEPTMYRILMGSKVSFTSNDRRRRRHGYDFLILTIQLLRRWS